MSNISANEAYRQWLTELKTTIRARQIKAALAVNTELIRLYWELGKSIVLQQEAHGWGSKVIPQLAKDLKSEFPDLSGFSTTNLKYCRIFYLFYSDFAIGQQPVDQFKENNNILVGVPWGHHILILQTIKSQETALYYLKQTIEHNWSRNVLSLQIDSKLHSKFVHSLIAINNRP